MGKEEALRSEETPTKDVNEFMASDQPRAEDSDAWEPMVVLPNVVIEATVFDSQHGCIVSVHDARVVYLTERHPNFAAFLGRFENQFGGAIAPSVLLFRTTSPRTYYSRQSLGGFRDIVAASTMPHARAKRVRYDRRNGLVNTTALQFYPWMIARDFSEYILLDNAGEQHLHIVGEFGGQTFPEQSRLTVGNWDVDEVIAQALIARWLTAFGTEHTQWDEIKLFRSLNMANEAARLPAITAGSFYDVGRLLGLWVSAFEILTHPGGDGRTGFDTVTGALNSIAWLDQRLTAASCTIMSRGEQTDVTLPVWLYKQMYDLRNSFLHGNEVTARALMVRGHPLTDFAACLYRMLLADFLALRFERGDEGAFAQDLFESALGRAIA